jgi:hypothetical protein
LGALIVVRASKAILSVFSSRRVLVALRSGNIFKPCNHPVFFTRVLLCPDILRGYFFNISSRLALNSVPGFHSGN